MKVPKKAQCNPRWKHIHWAGKVRKWV